MKVYDVDNKKSKLLISFVFIFMFVLYGCTSSGNPAMNEDESTLLYEAISINQEAGIDNVYAMSLNSNNQLAISQYDSGSILLIDKEGKTIDKYESPTYNKSLLAFNNTDSLYIIPQSYTMDDNGQVHSIQRQLIVADKDNPTGARSMPFKVLESTKEDIKNEIFKKMMIDSKGNIYALKLNGEIEIYDENLNKIKVLGEKQYKDIAIDEKDNLIALCLDSEKSTIEYIDTKNYKTKWEKEYQYSQAPNLIFYNLNNKTLYGLANGVIIQYDSEGNPVKELLDYIKLSALTMVYDMAVDSEGQIYILAESGDRSVLLKYMKNENKIANSETEEKKLVVYVYNDLLSVYSNAARKFESLHKDIKVELKIHQDIGYFEYAKMLNTEMLTGKGPDIIGSFYPLKEYAEKGLLVNLDEMIEKDKSFDINDYYENIIDGCRQEGKLYAMPVNYYFHGFIVNDKLMKEKNITIDNDYTFDELYDAAQKLNSGSSSKEYYIFPQIKYDRQHFEYIFYNDIEHYIDWEKKTAKFDSEEFINLLRKYKELRQNYTSPNINEGDINPNKNNPVDNILMISVPIQGYDSIGILGKLYSDFKVLPHPKGEHTGHRLYKSDIVSINKNSRYKDETWEFIKLLLSQEVQSNFYEYSFLLNKNADKEMNGYYLEMQHKIKNPDNYFYTPSDIQQLKDIVQSLNKLCIDTDAIYLLLEEEIYYYVTSDRSAEEAAKIIQNKVELYLNE